MGGMLRSISMPSTRRPALCFVVGMAMAAQACGTTARPFGETTDAGRSGAAGAGGMAGAHANGGTSGSTGGGPGGASGGSTGAAGRPGSGGAGSGGAISSGGAAGLGGRTGTAGSAGGGGGATASGGRGGAAGKAGSGGSSGGMGGAPGGGGTSGRGGGAGMGGAGGTTCSALVKQYADQMPAAKECTSLAAGTQCEMQMPSNLECGIDCKTVVNDSRALGATYQAWMAAGCAAPKICPQIACLAVQFGVCILDTTSTTQYRCSNGAL
jgi:hypothetical protein